MLLHFMLNERSSGMSYFTHLAPHIMPGRIFRREWIVSDIGITVKAISTDAFDPHIRADEAAQHRIVQARIHVDQARLIVGLVTGKAKGRLRDDRTTRVLPIGLPAL